MNNSLPKRFENDLKREIQTKTAALFMKMADTEPEILQGPIIHLMDFLSRRPESIESTQFVEV